MIYDIGIRIEHPSKSSDSNRRIEPFCSADFLVPVSTP